MTPDNINYLINASSWSVFWIALFAFLAVASRTGKR